MSAAGTETTAPVDFFVLGAMKAATTGMCDWLDVQRGVAISQPKEPALFASDASLDQELPRVGDLFRGRPAQALRGDGSTDYTKFPLHSGVAERVKEHCPDARFIYMMREPVARAVSQYRFEYMLGGARSSFADAVSASPGLVDNGRYAFQLQQWLDHFPPDRFLLVLAEAFAADPVRQVARALEFLGLPGGPVTSPSIEHSNETANIVRQSRALRLVRESDLGRRLIRPLLPDRLVEGYKRRAYERSRPELTDADVAALRTVFDADLRDLTRLTGGPGITCETWGSVVADWTPSLLDLD